MPAGSTYSPIATTTLSSNATTITFSSVPQTYTDLVLEATMLQTGTATATNGFVNVNSVNATVFGRIGLQAGPTASGFTNQMDRLYFTCDSDASNWAFHTWNFQNYANTNVYKTIITRQNNTGTSIVAAVAYLWQSTAAIDTITITASDNMGAGAADQFVAGSTFTLYGIASA